MASPAEVTAMRRALELAGAPDFPVNPNPRVGCVLLSPQGSVLAEGFHRGAGTPHAEVAALAAVAPAAARGGTVVVTLEPCTGDDRADRCTEALLEAGVARVVYGQTDPNPRVSGGAARLRLSGVDVEGGLLVDEAQRLNPLWSLAVSRGWPYVTWKFAASLDGRSAAEDGTSRWITGEAARHDVHRLRATCDAVLVGTGTALADDPRLTVRDADDNPVPPARQPLRVVMGLRELPLGAHLRDDEARTVQLRTRDPAAALQSLHERQVRHVWLEGGPRLAAAFVGAGLVDEVIGYVAPVLLGSGRSALEDAGVATLADAVQLRLVDVTPIGGDVRLTLVRKD